MTDAVQIYHSLQTLARRQGRATSELHTLYVLERFLKRLTRTPYRDDLVLKGGVLLAVFALRRPTRDIDMQALDVTLDDAYLRKVVEAVAAVEADDGVVFDAETARVTPIRDEDEYSGLRIRLTAHLHTAKLFVHIDVSTGDPIWPEPQLALLPGLLGDDFMIVGYPVATVIAEKTITMLQRGASSTRWRDYVDLRNLARRYPYRAGDLASAIAAVATHRGVQLASLNDAVRSYDADAERKWAAWRRKTDIEEQSLPQLDDQLREIIAFLEPIMLGELAPEMHWNPEGQTWEPGAEDPLVE
ncbi:nucleotidyl transferase AbiEii/AbiGii toxin family protein [Cryobacterium luteum]|nr:nucleotidyl transferase AbiEii/AbiGii toxin family protein [Cryobacterium luteum]SEN92201.1 Predicted nucleotidyltransferase component of viral defense system [Cryobacterium luteum]